MIHNECIEAAVKELEASGIEPTVRHGGKHIAVLWVHNGQERVFHTAATPSDYRAPLNVRSDIRRMLRNDGVIEADGVIASSEPNLFLRGGQFLCDSRDIASRFGKQHKNVLRDIDKILEGLGDFGRLSFEPSSYVNGQGKVQRAFNLNRNGFALLAMGFTGPEALAWKVKYLTAFSAMEEELNRILIAHRADEETERRLIALEAENASIRGEINALIDLCFELPRPEPGYTIVKAHKRRLRKTGARAEAQQPECAV